MTRYIFPIFVVLLAIAMYELYIQPLQRDIGRAYAKEAEVQVALKEADTAQATLDEIAKKYESFPSDAEARLAEIIPEKIDPIRLLIDTTAFLEHNGFSAKSLAVSGDSSGGGEDTPQGSYQTHHIAFTLSASYDTFREFLHVLESSLALRDAANVSFSTAPVGANANEGGRPESIIHTYSIQITSYSLR
jgi:hypothetical protein